MSGQQTPEQENLLHITIGGADLLLRSADVREVVRPSALTNVPMGPAHLIGMANIRGQVVCIIDVGGVTALPSCDREQTSRTRFLVLRHASMHVGIWGDAVCGIRRIERALLPEPGRDHLAGLSVDGKSFQLLDCAGLLD